MALLLWVPHPAPPPCFHHSFTPRFLRSSSSSSRIIHHCKAAAAAAKKNGNDIAVVWFKHDLRIDDHPALINAASHYRSIIPLYIFDHRIISRFSDETLELALLALKDLQTSLKDHGSNLMIKFGDADTAIPELVTQVKAIDVFAEEEVEFDLRRMISSVAKSLSDLSLSEDRPQIVLWQTPFYDIKNLKELPTAYNDFEKLRLSPTTPVACTVLPQFDDDLNWGSVPTFDDVKRYMEQKPWNSNKSWISIKSVSAQSVLRRQQFNQAEMHDLIGGLEKSNLGEGNRRNLDFGVKQKKRLDNSVFISRKGNVVGGGTRVVLNALAAYLRYVEGTAKDDWQEVHEKLRIAESRTGASFGALFGSALFLGVISRRRVYYEAIKYEKERNAGFLSPSGYSTATVDAAADTVCSMEWYRLMALKSNMNTEGRYSIRTWRWNGFLIQYTVVGCEGPAVLLVHGFGAFLEHFRDNAFSIAKDGNRVWAITLLGFGKSEKPNIVYTELMWAELLRDFIVDVVGEPAHLVGNSIGGYFVASVAGVWPALVKSAVLVNTAGSVVPGYSSVPFTEERRTSWAARLGSRLILFYLRFSVGNIVKKCYPTNTGRADDWLINEMLRASRDPGVLVVLESVFNFNLSIPLNYLLKSFKGKILIVQGMKDPLSKSEVRLAILRKHCRGIVIKELDAGHCPHDECPEVVNSYICEWVKTSERSLQSC